MQAGPAGHCGCPRCCYCTTVKQTHFYSSKNRYKVSWNLEVPSVGHLLQGEHWGPCLLHHVLHGWFTQRDGTTHVPCLVQGPEGPSHVGVSRKVASHGCAGRQVKAGFVQLRVCALLMDA